MSTVIPTTPDVILLALRNRLMSWLGWGAELLPIALKDNPPFKATSDFFIVIRETGMKPIVEEILGGGRLNYRIRMTVALTLNTKLSLDTEPTRVEWLTNKDNGHLIQLVKILDGLCVYALTDDGKDTGNWLVYEPIILEGCSPPEPDRLDEANWGQSALRTDLDFTLKLTNFLV